MNKKKVKKLLEDADICFLGYERNGCRDLVQMGLKKLHEAQDELSKSDWVSVEDELPEYDKRVLVCNKRFPDHLAVTVRLHTGFFDNHEFIIENIQVTHWKPIEKLEE